MSDKRSLPAPNSQSSPLYFAAVWLVFESRPRSCTAPARVALRPWSWQSVLSGLAMASFGRVVGHDSLVRPGDTPSAALRSRLEGASRPSKGSAAPVHRSWRVHCYRRDTAGSLALARRDARSQPFEGNHALRLRPRRIGPVTVAGEASCSRLHWPFFPRHNFERAPSR